MEALLKIIATRLQESGAFCFRLLRIVCPPPPPPPLTPHLLHGLYAAIHDSYSYCAVNADQDGTVSDKRRTEPYLKDARLVRKHHRAPSAGCASRRDWLHISAVTRSAGAHKLDKASSPMAGLDILSFWFLQ